MNIFLIPYTWARHLHLALVVGGAALLSWWVVLFAMVHLTWWSEAWDGGIFLGALAGSTAGASVLAEMSLRREAMWKRFVLPFAASALACTFAGLWFWVWTDLVGPRILSQAAAADLSDPSLVALRYRLLPFAAAGLSAAVGTVAVRRFVGFFTQIGAGLAAGLVAGACWYAFAYPGWKLGRSDLHFASAFASLGFGVMYGLGAWGIPDALYAGWLRVSSEHRHGRRIPIDGVDGGPRERFVGHFPRGLHLFLSADDGVQELHVSVAVDKEQRYRLRGLTLDPTWVRRFLETVDLRYDPRRAAPLETLLHSGDRIVLGKGKHRTVLEFLMLPREER